MRRMAIRALLHVHSLCPAEVNGIRVRNQMARPQANQPTYNKTNTSVARPHMKSESGTSWRRTVSSARVNPSPENTQGRCQSVKQRRERTRTVTCERCWGGELTERKAC
jgi:hypothetical protein